jgi:hypothetical protein
MIPMMNIIAWSNVVPWTEQRQVEQDLIISRAIVDLFADPFLSARQGAPPPPGTVAITDPRARTRFAILFAKARMGWRETGVDEHRGKPGGRMIYRVRSPRPSATNSGAARRCRRDLLQSSAADRLLAIQQHLAGRRCPLAQDLRQIRRIMARGRKTPGPRHRLPALPAEHEH